MDEDKVVEALDGIRVEVNGIRKVLQVFLVIMLISIIGTMMLVSP